MRPLIRLLPRFLLAATFVFGVTACGSGISLDEPIEGPVWWLSQLGDQPVAPGNDPQRDAQIQFDRSGRVAGSGGCNRISGTFTRAGSALRIGQLMSTKMACLDGSRSATEAQFTQALQTTANYRLSSPGRLALLDTNGRTLALLDARATR